MTEIREREIKKKKKIDNPIYDGIYATTIETSVPGAFWFFMAVSAMVAFFISFFVKREHFTIYKKLATSDSFEDDDLDTLDKSHKKKKKISNEEDDDDGGWSTPKKHHTQSSTASSPTWYGSNAAAAGS